MDWLHSLKTLVDAPHVAAFACVFVAWRVQRLETRLERLAGLVTGCPVCRKRSSLVPIVLMLVWFWSAF